MRFRKPLVLASRKRTNKSCAHTKERKTDIERYVCLPKIYLELYAVSCDSLKGTPDTTGDLQSALKNRNLCFQKSLLLRAFSKTSVS